MSNTSSEQKVGENLDMKQWGLGSSTNTNVHDFVKENNKRTKEAILFERENGLAESLYYGPNLEEIKV